MAFWRFKGASAADEGEAGWANDGDVIIVLAACEAAIALAILLNLYFNIGTVEVDSVHE